MSVLFVQVAEDRAAARRVDAEVQCAYKLRTRTGSVRDVCTHQIECSRVASGAGS
jgi:hypothetical protein